MKLIVVLLGVELSVFAAVSTAAAQSAQDVASQVLAAEKARTAALDRSDLGALQRIMADDDTYVHASGKVDSKASYLAAIRSGVLRYISWRPIGPLQVRALDRGDAAVLNGEYRVRVTDSRMQKAPFDVDILVLSVYERRDGRWQQVAWQSTRATPANPPLQGKIPLSPRPGNQ
jgi:ketosteroid isomerase-like protein